MIRRFLLVFILFSTASASADIKVPKGLMKLDSRPAPPLVLSDMDGEQWNIKNEKGRWVFVHFWATWCGPCRREMPTIQAIYPEFENSDLKIVVINTAETDDQVFSFLAAVAPDLNPFMDRDGLATERWQPRGLPSTYLVDPQGRLQYLALGGRPWDQPEYLEFLRQLIKTK